MPVWAELSPCSSLPLKLTFNIYHFLPNTGWHLARGKGSIKPCGTEHEFPAWWLCRLITFWNHWTLASQSKKRPLTSQEKCCESVSCPVVPDSLRPMDCGQPGCSVHPWNSPGKNIRVGCHSPLWRIFSIQGLKQGLPHCRQILYHLSHQDTP